MPETQREPVPRADTGELDGSDGAIETARHAGHADIIREQIDGETGR